MMGEAILVLNGLTHAGLLFVLGSGLTLAFGLMRVVNLSHGAFYLLGGYLGVTVFRGTGNWFLALLAAGVGIAILGVFFERVLLDRVRGQALPETLLTIALSIIIADMSLAIWGGFAQTIRVPAELNPRINLFGLVYPGFRLFILGLAVVIGLGLWFLLSKTRVGAAVRAGVDDRETVSALGINIRQVFTAVFALSAFLAGIAGVIGASFLSIQPGADTQILILSLVVVILGGLGSLGGAVVAAVVTGLLLSFSRAYFPELSFFMVFGPMALVLAFRPQGLFGKWT
jgi:branched-chain amino acid transport system permease protein